MVTAAPAPSFRVGDRIQEYRLRQVCGQSSFGLVWEAENEKGEGRALRFLPNPDDPATRQEIRAIQMVARLEHPHLMPIEKVWTIPKYFVVAMILAEGSLHDLLEAYQTEYGTGIEPVELCGYLTQAASALDFLNLSKHQLGSWAGGIQHGDVKPSNLLVFGEKVKLSDCNLASPASRTLQFGSRVGSAGYVAPEVWQGRVADTTDQYALAVTYCFLRGGKLPIIEKPPELGQVPAPRPAPDLSMLTVPERPIIARALSLGWRDRWKTCCELMANLTQAIGKKK